MRTLGFAILGLLSREELSGYDLMGWMREPVGFFWQASHSQIYPELARLEAEGMVTHRLVEQRERPDKKVYRITDTGMAALEEWVVEPPSSRPERDEMVLKAYSLWLADPRVAASLFEEQEHEHERQLHRYEEIEAWMKEKWGKDVERVESPCFASYAALRRGLIHERGYIEWCRWVADKLQGQSSG